jgi:D-galactarolactone cycloisomerase
MADANRAYDIRAASEIGATLAAHDFHWLEEPLSSIDVNEHLSLKKLCPVLLAAGESWESAEFDAFLRAHAIDVAQPNVGNIGGLQEAAHVLQLAAIAGIRVALHSWGTPVALAAAVHLACGTGGLHPPLVEFDCTPNPLREILEEPIVSPVGGSLAVPKGPGLGVSVNEQALKRFCVDA